MNDALRKHKEIMKSYPREGAGLEATVDGSDTGYTTNAKSVEGKSTQNKASKSVINDNVADGIHPDGATASKKDAEKFASGPEGVDGAKGYSNGCC